MPGRFVFPAEILAQHVAVLGKTGSGKTSTAKLAIEQVVGAGARVCVLDPIKSDWWGLTSSADGKHGGLPFHILGGPRGHVPLHSSAGKAIGEIVASGALPLSIIDMADFEPGGQAKFFVDFAPTLLRKMRGVVYLVIEEAHLFAPKERSGVGAENLSIHWAKTLATAGRSKGIRLVLVTQRTQALHNALLGSCDTLIAHRLTAPADQEPVIKWLRANTSKDVLDQVASSLAGLKTGHGWMCSGEARRFELVHFPRIATYDNTATPDGDTDQREVKTAAVDPEKLRAIIGEAVEQAEADDPRELRKRIAELEKQIASKTHALSMATAGQQALAAQMPAKEVPALTETDRELLKGLRAEFAEFRDAIAVRADLALQSIADRAKAEIDAAAGKWTADIDKRRALFLEHLEKTRVQRVLDKIDQVIPKHHAERPGQSRPLPAAQPGRTTVAGRPATRPTSSGPGEQMPPGERAVLTAAAMYEGGVSRDQLGVLTGYKRSSRDAYIARLAAKGWLDAESNGHVTASAAGIAALGDSFEPLPVGSALLDWWRSRLPQGERIILDVLIAAGGLPMAREGIDQHTSFKRSSRDAYLSRLAARRLVESVGRGEVRASSALFD